MQKLEIFIEENATGAVRPVAVAADTPVSALVPALVEEMELPRTDLFGQPLTYMLRPAAGRTALPGNTTLAACGIRSGTRLALDALAVEDAVAAPAYRGPRTDSLHSSPTIADAMAFAVPGMGDTSAHLAAVTSARGKTSRRSFLLLAGAALGAGGVGMGLAAYHAWQGGLLNSIVRYAVPQPMQQAMSRQQAAPAKATLPTMAKPLLSFTQHHQIVRAVKWSPDGMLLASGADDAHLFIWSAGGNVRLDIPHGASVQALAWAPDGRRVVSGSGHQVAFFDVQTGQMLARSTHRHTGTVTSLAWTPHNAMQVVSGAADRLAIIWNTTDYLPQTIFTRHTAAIESVSWSADGQAVASSSLGGVVRVWNAASGLELHGLYYDGGISLRTLAFAPSGVRLAVGGDDGRVRLWNGLTCGQQRSGVFGNQCLDAPQRLPAAQQALRSLAWSPDGRLLAVGAADGTLSLWYPAQGQQPLFTVQMGASVHSIAWSPQGDRLAAASGNTVAIFGIM
ncbi:MAG TPA: EsaB/YukD family protein [Ktedonobacteraceae bacterium]|nr:EsaB/YukD family protein [Ktedonobacteraceae bacterium]